MGNFEPQNSGPLNSRELTSILERLPQGQQFGFEISLEERQLSVVGRRDYKDTPLRFICFSWLEGEKQREAGPGFIMEFQIDESGVISENYRSTIKEAPISPALILRALRMGQEMPGKQVEQFLRLLDITRNLWCMNTNEFLGRLQSARESVNRIRGSGATPNEQESKELQIMLDSLEFIADPGTTIIKEGSSVELQLRVQNVKGDLISVDILASPRLPEGASVEEGTYFNLDGWDISVLNVDTSISYQSWIDILASTPVPPHYKYRVHARPPGV